MVRGVFLVFSLCLCASKSKGKLSLSKRLHAHPPAGSRLGTALQSRISSWYSLAATVGSSPLPPKTNFVGELQKMAVDMLEAREFTEQATPSEVIAFYNMATLEEASSRFAVRRFEVPKEMKHSLLNYSYYLPFFSEVMRDSASNYPGYIRTARIQKNVLSKDGKLQWQYAHCVQSRKGLDLPSGAGHLATGESFTEEEKQQKWGLNSSNGLGNLYRLNYLKEALSQHQPAHQMDSKTFPQQPWVAYAHNAVVYRSGSVRAIGRDLTHEHLVQATGCYAYVPLGDTNICRKDYDKGIGSAKRYDKVFVVAQMMGETTFHFMCEVLPRIALFLSDIVDDPDMLVHVPQGASSRFKKTHQPKDGGGVEIAGVVVKMMQYLGISSDRLVSGVVYADHMFVPQETGCGRPGDNFWQVNMLREVMLSRAQLTSTRDISVYEASLQKRKLTVVLIRRGDKNHRTAAYSGSVIDATAQVLENNVLEDYSPEKSSSAAEKRKEGREEEEEETPDEKEEREERERNRASAVRAAELDLEVKLFSDEDEKLLGCVKCIVELFHGADIVIAEHGAGLSNIIFTRVGTLVLELYTFGLPPCFVDLAFSLGLEHRGAQASADTLGQELLYALGAWALAMDQERDGSSADSREIKASTYTHQQAVD